MKEIKFEQKDFINNYNELKSSRKMAKLYNCSKDAILKYAKEIGYVNNYLNSLTDEEKQTIIDAYDITSSGVLAERFKVSRSLILKTWIEAGLKGKISYKYPFNQDYFEKIDTNDKAYFLGLIASDGNITLRKNGESQGVLRISLLKEDADILEVMKIYVSSKKPLRFQVKENTNYFSYMATLELVSNKMANDLKNYNIVPQKTYEYLIPNISMDLMRHFIRGYFDGDGSISLTKAEWHTPSAYTCSICGFYKNLKKIQQVLQDNGVQTSFIEETRTEKIKNSTDRFGSLVCNNIENNYNFIKYIYEDCGDLYLHRKKYKADCFLNAINKNFANKKNYYNEIKENAVLNEDRV